MNPLFVSVAFFVTFTGAMIVAAQRFYIRPAQVRERLGAPVVTTRLAEKPKSSLAERAINLLRRVGNLRSARRNDDTVRRELIAAGYRSENALQVFIGVRTAALAASLLGAAVVPIGADANPALRIVLLMGGAGIGWRIPAFMLKKRMAARQERLRLSLPDALDLIIISVEAGLGLDQAIQHVALEMKGTENADLSDELQLIGMEMRAGKRRADALRAFAERTGEDEIQKLVALMVQNDKFGTSMSEAMRNHSQFMRVQRRQQADERASRVGVKLVFPIFFFILPSMMTVAAGPGILQIFKYMFPMMKQLK